MFGVGVARIITKDNRNLFDTTVLASQQKKLTEETNTGALWNTGFRFYLSESWSIRLDMTGVSYKADKTKSDESLKKSTATKIFSNYDLGLGLNYAF
jgi:opacity protein-like surface antigen